VGLFDGLFSALDTVRSVASLKLVGGKLARRPMAVRFASQDPAMPR